MCCKFPSLCYFFIFSGLGVFMFFPWFRHGLVFFFILLLGLLFFLIFLFFRSLPSSRSSRFSPRSSSRSPSSSLPSSLSSRRLSPSLSSPPSSRPSSFRSKYDFCRDWPLLLSACLGDVHKAHRLVEFEARRSPTAAPDTLVTYALLSLRHDRR